MNKKLRISIVIPVYNEAERLTACLQAVMAQTVRPYEIIVVDNNSTDDTVRIARRFPGVRLLHETRQGVVFARDRGFNAAVGDVIGRIDADTLVSADWLATLQRLFADQRLAGVTGSVTYRDIAANRLVNRIDLFWRRRMARLLGPDVALQGANMAIRRDVWQSVRSGLCHRSGLHEDFDLAIHATHLGHQLRFAEELKVAVMYRQAAYDFRSFASYSLTSPRTYAAHGIKSGRHMYQVVAFVLACYPAINVLHRGYDHAAGRFRWGQLFGPALPPRVNPATFVD